VGGCERKGPHSEAGITLTPEERQQLAIALEDALGMLSNEEIQRSLDSSRRTIKRWCSESLKRRE
jgi:DNA invertase Pin-like site-specific DNA recombinase